MSIHRRRLFSRIRRALLIFGFVAVGVGLVAVYAAAIHFFADSRPGGTGTAAENGDVAAIVGDSPPPAPKFPASDYRQDRYPRPTGEPLIGVNYTHYAMPNCTFPRTYIPAYYHRKGGAEKVHSQLKKMRAAGVATIRTVLWHDEMGQDWGPIPTPGGKLLEPFRTNLIRYVTEVRRFGFARLTIAFDPKETHNPLLRKYDPSKFRENWRFIRTVRRLVKRYGPRSTRFDLFSEGAPNEKPTAYEPLPQQTAGYIRRMYRLYVKRFGNRDVSVSAIGSLHPEGETNRLEYLIRTLRSSGAPLPRWYDLHIGHLVDEATYSLQHGVRALDRQGQDQPLVIGDLGYDNAGIARAIQSVIATSSRRVQEVTPWYAREPRGCQVPPPYTPGAYGKVLHGR